MRHVQAACRCVFDRNGAPDQAGYVLDQVANGGADTGSDIPSRGLMRRVQARGVDRLCDVVGVDRTSSRARTRSPLNDFFFQCPTSSCFSCSKDLLLRLPPTPAVRLSRSSWKTTICPSRVSWQSISIMSASASIAFSKANRVFSGKSPEAPRWATLTKAATDPHDFAARTSQNTWNFSSEILRP